MNCLLEMSEQFTRFQMKLPEWIRQEIERTASARGTRVEFYDAKFDIALYQLFPYTTGTRDACIAQRKPGVGILFAITDMDSLLRRHSCSISMKRLIQSISRIEE